MARTIPEGRFTELVRAGTSVFISLGYHRSQMADVAAAMGVAKGTLYVYVESKEALFELCTRYCDAPDPVARPEHLPYPTPPEGALRQRLSDRLEAEGAISTLSAALSRKRARDVRGELSEILGEVFDAMHRNRFILRLVDRCVGDHPELPRSLQRQVREGLQGELARYLELPARSRQLRAPSDAFLSARVVIETLTTWAVHIHWDPVPQVFDPKRARDTVIEFVLAGLLRDPQN
jgi:AcrR family transcriptional regulator